MNYFTEKVSLSRDFFNEKDKPSRFSIEIPQSRGAHITGIKMYEVGEKNNEFSIGLTAHDKEVQASTYKEDWTRTTEQTKLKEIIIENMAGRRVYFDIKSEEIFTGDTTLHIVIILED